MITLRPATTYDYDAIWDIFSAVIADGDTFIYSEDISKQDAHTIWMENTRPYIAELDGKIVGTYVIRPNKIGRGSHVCNAGFMVHPDFQNNGVGKAMGEDALKQARKLGYLAMQFNIVVSTNARSIHLWKRLGFNIIGTIPKGFDHKQKGLVDIHIMHRFL